MIHAVDEGLRRLLQQELGALPGGPPQVRFSAPGEGPEAEEAAGNAVHLILYDVRENVAVREHGRLVEKDIDRKTATVFRPPVHMDLRYAVCARAETHEEEHALLSWALAALLQHSALDLEALLDRASPAGEALATLRDPQPFPMQIAQPDLLPDPLRFWEVLGRRPRPAFSLSVTAMLEPRRPQEAPLVTQSIMDMAPEGGTGAVPRLQHWVAIAGTVSAPGTEEPAPLAGARVHLLEPPHAAVLTDQQGFFFFLDLPGGVYSVRAYMEGREARTQRVAVQAARDGAYALADFLLHPAALWGTVRRLPEEKPLAGATVRVAGVEVSTDSEGYYAFAGLPAGTHEIEVSAAGCADARQPVSVGENGRTSRRMDLGLGAAALSGSVLNRATRAAIAGARISIPGWGEVKTNRQGRFSVPHLPPAPGGRYLVVAEAEGYRPGESLLKFQDRTATRPPVGAHLLLELEPDAAPATPDSGAKRKTRGAEEVRSQTQND